MRPVRLGFVGVGWIAQRSHFPALAPLAEDGQIVFQAFCDSNPETLHEAAERYGVERTYSDHHALLEREELDALFILIPPTLHTDAEILAAERGIHLFVEKPQTLDLHQARQFEAAIHRSGILAQVGFMSRYYPTAERVKELLAKRLVRHANIQLFYGGAPVRYWTSRMELCGGSFVENTIHFVDLLRYFCGDISDASAFYVARKTGDPERGPMDLPHAYLVNYRFASGVVANFTTSRCLTEAGGSRREVALVSENSLIEWFPDRVVENGEVILKREQPDNAFALQAQAFVRAVREHDPTLLRSPYSEAMNSLAAVLAANESARNEGQVVDVGALQAG